MDTFRPFSLQHLIVAIVFCAICAGSIIAARCARTRTRLLAERAFSIACIVLFVAVNDELWLNTHLFIAGQSLPIHVCDLVLLIAPVALTFNWWPARVVLYYFGVLLSSQGLFTPDLHEGPAHLNFWGFWLMHLAVVGAGVYDLGARGYRPGWRDLRLAVCIGAVYVAIMVAINVAFGFNYGYVGPTTPQNPTIIDVLGPWPQRVFVMSGLTFLLMALATIPWVIGRRRAKAPRGQNDSTTETRTSTDRS